jgi:hypothetical protein
MRSQRPPVKKFKKMRNHEITFQEKQASSKTPSPSKPDFSKNDAISSIGRLGKK